MKNLAARIIDLEGTGLLDALEQRDVSGAAALSRAAMDGSSLSFFRALPQTLVRRAEMCARLSEFFPARNFTRDLLSRVNRLCLSVYVKLVTNEDDYDAKAQARHDLVVKIMRDAGLTADKSQLRRELRYFESEHFMAHSALRDKLKRLHSKS